MLPDSAASALLFDGVHGRFQGPNALHRRRLNQLKRTLYECLKRTEINKKELKRKMNEFYTLIDTVNMKPTLFCTNRNAKKRKGKE